MDGSRTLGRKVIAHDLEPKPHTVKLKVLNTTHSEEDRTSLTLQVCYADEVNNVLL